jgi:hypothetical protein
MTRIRLRPYTTPDDLDLQHKFWLQATRDLRWCWKPTRSPDIHLKGPRFDPRSRCFAVEEDRVVGYMSFSGQAPFVSLGYPWVLPGYEGELQERLYDTVYGFASSPEYGGKTFAQRLREPWEAQISFFRSHGFLEQQRTPIYALDVPAAKIEHDPGELQIQIESQFLWNEFYELAVAQLAPNLLDMLAQYYQSVDFDFSVMAVCEGKSVAYSGFTLRHDTGFAEMNAVAAAQPGTVAFEVCLAAATRELRTRGASFLATGPLSLRGGDDLLRGFGFKKVSEEVLLWKTS